MWSGDKGQGNLCIEALEHWRQMPVPCTLPLSKALLFSPASYNTPQSPDTSHLPHPLHFLLPWNPALGVSYSFIHQSQPPPSERSLWVPVLRTLWDSEGEEQRPHFLVAHQWTGQARIQLAGQCYFHTPRTFWPWQQMTLLLNSFPEIFTNKLPFSGQFPNNWSLSKSEEVAHQRERVSSLRGMHSAYHFPWCLKGNTQGAPKAFPPSV